MTNSDHASNYEDLIETAKQNALALCRAEVGSVRDMANDEAYKVLGGLLRDPDRLLVLVRVLTLSLIHI